MNIYYVRVSNDRTVMVYVRNKVRRLGMMWVQSSEAYRWSTLKLSIWKESTGGMSTLTTH
jgi:hypothetical protein